MTSKKPLFIVKCINNVDSNLIINKLYEVYHEDRLFYYLNPVDLDNYDEDDMDDGWFKDRFLKNIKTPKGNDPI